MKRGETEFLKGEEILMNIIYVITPLEDAQASSTNGRGCESTLDCKERKYAKISGSYSGPVGKGGLER
nr:hypothetical protein Q903MT_gene887 [Picea sitchensis]